MVKGLPGRGSTGLKAWGWRAHGVLQERARILSLLGGSLPVEGASQGNGSEATGEPQVRLPDSNSDFFCFLFLFFSFFLKFF